MHLSLKINMPTVVQTKVVAIIFHTKNKNVIKLPKNTDMKYPKNESQTCPKHIVV
jgi:hypothetical protein